MIESLKNDENITINLFGKEKTVRVFSTGDNRFDENGKYKEPGFDLNKKELEVLNWFIENVKIEDYKEQIAKYINDTYEMWSDKRISPDDVENEINITAIAINVKEKWQSNSGFVYPEISFYGDCECDEGGICIGFRDGKFLDVNAQDWTL